MDTVTSGSFGPRPERSVQVVGCSVGRKDPTPPRHEARRPCLPEVGSQATTGLSVIFMFCFLFYDFSSLHSSRCTTNTLAFWSMSSQHTSSFHPCNMTARKASDDRAFPLNNYLHIRLLLASSNRSASLFPLPTPPPQLVAIIPRLCIVE